MRIVIGISFYVRISVVFRLALLYIVLGILRTCMFLPYVALRKTVEERNQLYYPVLYLLAVMFSLTMYWTACLADPGFVPISKVSAELIQIALKA